MSEHWCVEKTMRPDGSCERFEFHFGDHVYVLSLEKGEDWARGVLSLLGIEVAQIESDIKSIVAWAKTDNPIEGKEKWDAMPEYVRDQIAPCPNVEPEVSNVTT